jgi:hypothetical protein
VPDAPDALIIDGVIHPVDEPGACGSAFCEKTGISTLRATYPSSDTGGHAIIVTPELLETDSHILAS